VAVLIAVLVLVLIGLVVLVVSAPLRRAGVHDGPAGEERRQSEARAGAGRLRRDELEAARETKYREIRDAEMDFRTGKLSEQDYAVLDAELRAEALAVLDALQELDATELDTDQG
jgi:hypothetical protein